MKILRVAFGLMLYSWNLARLLLGEQRGDLGTLIQSRAFYQYLKADLTDIVNESATGEARREFRRRRERIDRLKNPHKYGVED